MKGKEGRFASVADWQFLWEIIHPNKFCYFGDLFLRIDGALYFQVGDGVENEMLFLVTAGRREWGAAVWLRDWKVSGRMECYCFSIFKTTLLFDHVYTFKFHTVVKLGKV